MTTAQHPERYRPEPSGRFAADLSLSDNTTSVDPGDEPRAPQPKASPLARGWTIVLGLVLLGVTAVIIRDVLILNDSVSGRQLLPPVFAWFATVQNESWMLWAGIGCALVAAFFLLVSVRPRRRTHMAFGDGSELYARPVDVARLSTATARRVPGVLSAHTVATRKKISVKVVTAVTPESTETIRARVSTHVSELSALLDPAPNVQVTVTPGGEGR
ncbi:Putative membrane protein [Corynebacterium glyciniphilum AJ 3170]|uniref:Putative membrane protein n=1 Tax=Corynebacterium glyciniphilum AJ 3170 TaxID=1404245 RepID=X5EBR6_9CORY|nr:DUF6286 domain-containing protein [Corynebacterium glyciniphilum]AHW64820.1 Putative membrane protein [Corynebacterium glyciniphilum AJ 3170]